MFYKLYADGTIQGRAGVPQEGWEELSDCPFEHARWDGKKWIEDKAKADALKAEADREVLIQAEIRKIAEERLAAKGKL